jgi:hypothetical protein
VVEKPESPLGRPDFEETWTRLRENLSPDALSMAAASDDPRTRSVANLILGLVDPDRQVPIEPHSAADVAPKTYRLSTPTD